MPCKYVVAPKAILLALSLVVIACQIPTVVVARTITVPRWSVSHVQSADEFNTIDSALSAAQGGDRIYVKRGTYTAPLGGWKITKSLEIFGDGPGYPWSSAGIACTWLQPANPDSPIIVLDLSNLSGTESLPNVYIHDMSLGQTSHPGSVSARSYGILARLPSNHNLVDLRLARLGIWHMGSDGIHLEAPNTSTGAIVGLTIEDVESAYNLGSGLYVLYATVMRAFGGIFHNNSGAGATILGCSGVQLVRNAFEANQQAGTATTDDQLRLQSCHNFLVTGGHFEDWIPTGSSARNAISVIDCKGGYIGSCGLGNNSAISGSRGIHLWYAEDRSIVIGPNTWSQVDVLIEVENVPTITSCFIQPQAIFLSSGVASKIIVPEVADRGHVVMPPTLNASNITAGIEFPRLSVAKRDSMTAASSGGTRREGLAIYSDATKDMNFFDGTRWRENVAFFPTTTAANAPPGGINLPAIASTTRDNMPTAFRTAGTLIFNSSTNELNYWNGSAWRAVTNKNP